MSKQKVIKIVFSTSGQDAALYNDIVRVAGKLHVKSLTQVARMSLAEFIEKHPSPGNKKQ